MTTRDTGAEARVAEALRARASGAAGRDIGSGTRPDARPTRADHVLLWALLVALLAGAVLGAGLALVSVLAPGLLPALG